MDAGHYERAIGYPWERRPGSCLVTDTGVEDLGDLNEERREELVRKYLHDSSDRVPLLTYGANSSPERLALKLAHLPENDHEALIVAGDLDGFDVAPHAHPPLFSSMAATLMPSPETSVRIAVLFLTPAQFTALWWTELTYLVGALSDVTLMTELSDKPIDRVILFVSRWGTFCVDGEPVAMAAIPAKNRRSAEMTQADILEAAAHMTLGKDAGARLWSRPRTRTPQRSWPTTSACSAPRRSRSSPSTGPGCRHARPASDHNAQAQAPVPPRGRGGETPPLDPSKTDDLRTCLRSCASGRSSCP